MSASDQLLSRAYARAQLELVNRARETGSLYPMDPYKPPLVQGRRALHNRGLAWQETGAMHPAGPPAGWTTRDHRDRRRYLDAIYGTRRLHETGASPWGDLGSLIGSEVMVPAVITALQDPQTQAQIQRTMVDALESPETKRALRPYVIEAAVWATIAITLGGFAWRWITK
jgi:hypothetical protein